MKSLKEWSIERSIEGMASSTLDEAVEAYIDLDEAGKLVLADLVWRSIIADIAERRRCRQERRQAQRRIVRRMRRRRKGD